MTCTSIYNPLLTPIRKDGNRILLDIIKMVPNPYRKIVRMIAKQYNVDSMENSDSAYIQASSLSYRAKTDNTKVCTIMYSNSEGSDFEYKFNYRN